MASEFVRKVKGIRNIDILSPNITTENDLISTIDGEVYVATNKGYRKITGVETKEIKQLKTNVSNVKTQSDTNTLNISYITDDIEKLETSTDNNKSEIKNLKTSTDNNTSEVETLKTSTSNNESEISNLIKSIDSLNENIKTLNNYIEVKTFKDIDLMDKNSLDNLPLGVSYLISADNKPTEMKTNNGWLTVHYGNDVKRFMFQPYSEGRTYYNYILRDSLGEWQ